MDPRVSSYGAAATIFLLDRVTKWLIEGQIAIFKINYDGTVNWKGKDEKRN